MSGRSLSAPLLRDADAELDSVRSRRIGVIGYGNQGAAQALNLRDSGCTVRIGLYAGSRSAARARQDGFEVDSVREVAAWADLIALLLPDQAHRAVFEESIRAGLQPGDMLLFAHGFSVVYGEVTPPAGVDVALVAPVGPGAMLRRLYLEGTGIPGLVAVEQDASGRAEAVALGYAAAIGCTRAGVLRSTFREETETDLFGEQVVLCGGLSHLIKAGFETLVAAGYQPEIAYFECLHQVKLIVDLIYESGIAGMHAAISDTAEYGDRVTGPRIVDGRVRQAMRAVLAGIQRGDFAREWIAEYRAGMPKLQELRAAEAGEEIERVGRELRAAMPWLTAAPTERPEESR